MATAGLLQFGAVALALTFVVRPSASAQTAEFVAKAKGYANRTVAELHIDPTDGVDRDEAGRIAEVEILGAVDLGGNPDRIASYAQPESDGLRWRVDVIQGAAVPAERRRGPLFVSKLSGRSFGEGWFNVGGPHIDLGAVEFYVDDWRQEMAVSISLKRLTHENDFAAKAEILNYARQVADIFNAKPRGCFEKIESRDITVGEGWVSDQPLGGPDRHWTAAIKLRLKATVP